jgi:phosphohistidine phosphatase
VKVLYLLRHAKSSWEDAELADHDRPLAPRGVRAARTIADQVRRQGFQPALVLCSSARRARDTLKPLQRVFAGKTEVRFESGLYAASAQGLLARLHSVPQEVPSVMLVGHNPGLQELGLMLARPSDRRDALERKFPTGALAAVELGVASWQEVADSSGELTSLMQPRELR